ncbi:MAG: hypothetical protein ACRDQ4_24510 [Pseudonocardiaceae bacterium]
MHGALAEELVREVVTILARSVGRREAVRLASWALSAVGLSDLDTDERTRVAQALADPRRVDVRVVNNLATTLAHCKRQEDTLGPCEVLDTVVSQQRIVRHLLKGGCPAGLRQPLNLVDSNMASSIGSYLVDMGQLDPQVHLRRKKIHISPRMRTRGIVPIPRAIELRPRPFGR